MALEIGTLNGASGSRFTQFETNMGHPLTYCRVFISDTSLPSGPQGGGQWQHVYTRAQQNRWVHVSWKPQNSWVNVANGAENARLTQIGNFLAGIPPHNGPHPNLWTFNHEPNEEGRPVDPSIRGPQFCAAFDKAYEIIKPLAPHWMSCNIYVGGVFYFNNQDGGPYPWWSNNGTMEVLGHDFYPRRGATSPTDTSNPGDWYATQSGDTGNPRRTTLYQTQSGRISSYEFAAQHGVPMVVPELGIPPLNPLEAGGVVAVQQERASVVSLYAQAWRDLPQLWGVCWYDRDSTESQQPGDTSTDYNNYAMGGGSGIIPTMNDPYSLAAFYTFTQSGTPTGPGISSFTPTSGEVGDTFVITGSGFTGTTAVRIGSVTCAFVVNSATQITATVGPTAATGVVSVTTSAGTASTTTPFTVTSTPSGSSYVPGVQHAPHRAKMALG